MLSKSNISLNIRNFDNVRFKVGFGGKQTFELLRLSFKRQGQA